MIAPARLLRGISSAAMDVDRHREVHGELRLDVDSGRLVAEVERSGLRGRGGGGFPLARKLEAVRRARGRGRGRGAPVVVVNAAEGEPMSAKDRMLVRLAPHLVIDGALCAAHAVGAGEIILAVDRGRGAVIEALEHALGERPVHETRQMSIATVPAGYVTGHESSLVNLIGGGAARPGPAGVLVAHGGVGRRPTLVSNAETLAHLALVSRHGAEWFRAVGTEDEPGTLLVTLDGGVRRPGVYEVGFGTPLSDLVAAAGGPSEPSRAFLLGGYAGGWIDGTAASAVRLSTRHLRGFGAALGPGIVVSLPRRACAVAETVRVAVWMADQSSGQCGPCVHGLASIGGALADVADGTGHGGELRDVTRWAGLVTGRGACAHPDGAARFVLSALNVFAEEFADHARHGPCDACDDRPVLRTPGVRHAAAV